MGLLKLNSKKFNKVRFTKAHDIQIQIVAQSKKEDELFYAKKEKERIKEVERITRPQVIEADSHVQKKNAAYMDFKNKRALNLNSLLQTFKNKRNQMKQTQKNMEIMQKNINKTKVTLCIPGSTKATSI